jgi:hypothetical protein
MISIQDVLFKKKKHPRFRGSKSERIAVVCPLLISQSSPRQEKATLAAADPSFAPMPASMQRACARPSASRPLLPPVGRGFGPTGASKLLV